jgi:uncharacterized membrane protein YdbT with pleckstrin-like domain
METPTPVQPEQDVWSGHPSQILGTKAVLVALLMVVVGLAGFYFLYQTGIYASIITVALVWVGVMTAWWKYLTIRATHYRLTTERLVTARGVVTRRIDELELYRVKDTSVIQPFWGRIINRGDIVLVTSDASSPTLTIHAVAQPERVRELIRKHVEAVRAAKGVREIDVE